MATRKHTITLSGTSVTLEDLRAFIEDAEDNDIDKTANVNVSVSPTTNNPTDRGGEILITVTG